MEIVIHDGNYQQFIDPVVNGEKKKCGTTPRNYVTHPHGCFAFAPSFNLPLIPESEWQDRLNARIAAKAQLSDVRNIGMGGQPVPSRDQNGKGYCLVPGTKVETGDYVNNNRNIERIQVGNTVRTAEGNWGKVTDCLSRHYKGDLIELFVDSVIPLQLTPEHPVYTRDIAGKTCYLHASEFDEGKEVYYNSQWRRLRGVKKRTYEGMVYNLEVEGDNSYRANGVGVHNCWAHSGTSAHLICRAVANQPYADLSAYAVACMIKGFRDEGGWGSEGIEFQSTKGIPTSQFWPQQSMSRSNDNPQTWANAALHKYVQWMELDPNQMKQQLVTCLLLGYPVVTDFNWWSHSVCTIDLVSLSPFQTRIWNSWGDSWSQNGTGILEGSKAMPDSAWAAMVMSVSAA